MSSLVHKVEKFNNKSIKWTSSLLNKVDEVFEVDDFISWTTSEWIHNYCKRTYKI